MVGMSSHAGERIFLQKHSQIQCTIAGGSSIMVPLFIETEITKRVQHFQYNLLRSFKGDKMQSTVTSYAGIEWRESRTSYYPQRILGSTLHKDVFKLT